MNNLAKINAFSFFITTKCTLRCKLCDVGIPYSTNPAHTPKQQVINEIRKTAELCRMVTPEGHSALHADLIGGEPLLHPEILEIAQEIYKHKAVFTEFRIVTNSTIVPKDDLLDFMKSANNSGVNFEFVLNNYGKISIRFDEILEKADKWGIPFRTYNYTGENQHFNGWVDIGDYPGHNRTKEEAARLFNTGCRFKTFINLPVWNSKIYSCDYQLKCDIKGAISLCRGEYLDLFDDTLPIEEKLNWLRLNWIKSEEPLSGCYHCNGFGVEGQERFPAAEQL